MDVMGTVFGLLGGLALFLFGMNMMSESLQKAAGDKMKSILSMLTSNPVLGVLAGALATAVLQSSSATTVMAIGFVSARLMSIRQAVSLIFGANIGTTMTAQLIAFKLSDYIWLIVFVGFIVWFVAKNQQAKNIGQSVFAFGLLFVGIETMGSVMEPLAQSQVFLDMIDFVKGIPVLGVAVGALMTMVVQSSSATIAVLQSFASQAGPDGNSILGIQGAIPILLGDNIGTTITALLASIGQSRDAKRVAIAHSTFNITGTLLFIWLVPVLAAWVQFLTPGPEVEVISRQIANAHTTFNICCTLIWLPFINVMVKIVTFLIPDKSKGSRNGALVYLDDNILSQPVFAIRMFGEELKNYCAKVRDMLAGLPDAIETKNAAVLKEIATDTQRVEEAEEQLLDYAVELLSAGSMTERQVTEVSSLMLIVESVGRIGSRCGEAASLYADRIVAKNSFSDEAREDLKESACMVSDMYDAVLRFLGDRTMESEREFDARRKDIIKRQNKARKGHFRRVSSKKCAPENKDAYNKLLLCFERAGNECSSLAEHGAELPEWDVDEAVNSGNNDTGSSEGVLLNDSASAEKAPAL